MSGKGGPRGVVKKVEVEGGVKAPDLSRVTDTIREELGGRVGQALIEGLTAVRDETVSSVNSQLDGLRADASAAREHARVAGAKAEEAAGHAGEAVNAAKAAGSDVALARTASCEAAESVATAERAVIEVRDLLSAVSISIGDKTFSGGEAITHISAILSSLAGLSVKRGDATVTGVDTVRDVVFTVEALEVTRGASTIKGPDALRELVQGLASIELTISKPATEEGQPPTNEKITGIDALVVLCGRLENLESDFVGRTDAALGDLLSAKVVVGQEEDGQPKFQTLTGSRLLMHVSRTVDSLSENLSGEVKSAVEAAFTATVSIDGRPIQLSGSDLAKYLVDVSETARAAAGTAVRRSEEEAKKAERSAAQAKLSAGAARTAAEETGVKVDALGVAVAEAFAAVDQKLGVIVDAVLKLAKDLGVSDLIAPDTVDLMREASFAKPDSKPAGEDKG